MSLPVSIELYSLRALSQVDFFGTIDKVKEMGYDGIEFAGFFNAEAEELKAKLDSLRLIATSSHTPIDQIENNLSEIMAYNKAIGNLNIVIPWADCDTPEAIEKDVLIMQKAAAILKENGMRLFYHNHKQEFAEYKGMYIMDYFMENVPDLYLQLDICWATKAGVEPAAYLEKYRGRTDLCHFKDIKGDTLTSIGTGDVDIASVVKKVHELSMSAVVIENDDPKPDPITDATLSINNLRNQFGI